MSKNLLTINRVMKRTATETKAIKAYIASIRENITREHYGEHFASASLAAADYLEKWLKARPTLSVGEMHNKLTSLECEIVEYYNSYGVMNYMKSFLEGLAMIKNWPFKED